MPQLPLSLWIPALGVLVLSFRPTAGLSQTPPDSGAAGQPVPTPPLQHVLDEYGADAQSSSRLSEQYAGLRENPLSLNDASSSELASLPAVSSGQARRIVQHRAEQGAFDHLSDLAAIDGVSRSTVRAIAPFVTLGPPKAESDDSLLSAIQSNLELDITQRFSRTLERTRGVREHRFLGPPSRLTTRVHIHSGQRFEAGLTLDKDPGEPVRWSPETGTYAFDHVAGSVALRDVSVFEILVLGHYSAQFGQGVAMWQGIRFGKGRDPVGPILRSGRGLIPYRSASESGYFQGAGMTLNLPGPVVATAFASHRHRDASPDSIHTGPHSSDVGVFARTVSGGGRHRTPSEIARKGTFGETVLGGAVVYRTPSLRVGATGYLARFDTPLRPGNRPYRRFRASGQQAYMTSVYGTAHLNDYLLFGEMARAANGAIGGVAGAALDRGDPLQAVLLGRYYPHDFPNFHGNSFGESGHPQNEVGVYVGMQLQVAQRWHVAAYFDQFRAPWLRYNVPLPSTGSEGRVVLRYAPRPWLSTYLQGRVQTDEEGSTARGAGGRMLEGTEENRRYSVRWHSEYSFSDALSIRTRFEVARHVRPSSASSGVFLSQGVRLQLTPSLQIDAQIGLFDTDDYASRIYAYERDLRYSFSVPVFFDKGRRSYLLLKYDPTASLRIEAKFGVTHYAHRSRVGSGLNTIEGNRQRELGVQIRWEL